MGTDHLCELALGLDRGSSFGGNKSIDLELVAQVKKRLTFIGNAGRVDNGYGA